MENNTPIGAIMMFSGKKIPYGWLICDGKELSKKVLKKTFQFAKNHQIDQSWQQLQGILVQNKLPDFTDRFVIGKERFKKLNETGEPDRHTHNVGSHKVSIKIKEGGRHRHYFPSDWYGRVYSGFKEEYSAIDTHYDYKKTDRTEYGGSHSHDVNVNSIYFPTGKNTGLNRPKWYALFYVMKVLI